MVHFSRSIVFQIPLAFEVSFFFKKGEKRVDGAGSKVNSEVLAEAGDYLISVHGLVSHKV